MKYSKNFIIPAIFAFFLSLHAKAQDFGNGPSFNSDVGQIMSFDERAAPSAPIDNPLLTAIMMGLAITIGIAVFKMKKQKRLTS